MRQRNNRMRQRNNLAPICLRFFSYNNIRLDFVLSKSLDKTVTNIENQIML